MLRSLRYRRLSLLVLAAYLAAGTLGMLWHEHVHGHAACCPAAHSEHDHDHDHAERGEQAALADHDHHGKHSKLHDDDCAVCQQAGVRTLVALQAPAAIACKLCRQIAPRAIASPALATPGIFHPRAPPAAV